jgi:hypothetical protein
MWSNILPRRPQRSAKVTHRQVLESSGVVLDGARRRVQVDGYVVHLTARETAVLSPPAAQTRLLALGVAPVARCYAHMELIRGC